MAIQIIGQSKAAEPTHSKLIEPDLASLPAPESAPAATFVHTKAQLIELLTHPEPMVRTFAIGHLASSEDEAVVNALALRVADEVPGVAESAVKALGERSQAAVVAAVEKRFDSAAGSLAGECARYLARHVPARLVELLKSRARLDDEAFAVTTAELGRSKSEVAIDYLDRTMNRAGTMPGERRSALYAAALLSGDKKLCQRVIGLALSDSKVDEPEGGTSPARAAVGSVAGLPLQAAIRAEGENVLKQLRDEGTAFTFFPAEVGEKLDHGLRDRDFVAVLTALEPMASLIARENASAEHKSLVERRRGLLLTVLEKKEAIASLGAGPAAVFILLAIDAAQMLALSAKQATDSPALITVAKVLETTPEALIAMDEAAFHTLFSERGQRGIRAVMSPLASETMFDIPLLERMLSALLSAGHGEALLDAAAEARSDSFVRLVVGLLSKKPESSEPVLIEALSRRPIEASVAHVVLGVVARMPTQRLALAVGRRFLELRDLARTGLSEAIFRLGDPKLTAIVKTRAYANEPEELTYCLLELLSGAPAEGDLLERLKRLRGEGPREPEFRIPLRCTDCEQVLIYGFEGVYVDPRSEKPDGDPAFIGEPVCKACGAYDHFESTQAAVQVMAQSMMQLLAMANAGGPMPETPVMPRTTRLNGKDQGLAAALRELDQAVKTSPDSIRQRLRRARLHLLLHRSRAEEDIQAALKVDPQSVEAKVMHAGMHAQRGALEPALVLLLEVRDALRGDEETRLYDAEAAPLLIETEDSILELEMYGLELPASVNLDEARGRLADHQAAEEEALRKMQSEQRGRPGGQ